MELALLCLFLSTALGMPAGILAAVHANRRLDVLIRSQLLFAFSVPTFVIGTDRRVLEVITSEVRMNTHADRALEALRKGRASS